MSWAAAAFIGSYPSPYNTRRDSDFDNYTTTYTWHYKIRKIMFLQPLHIHTTTYTCNYKIKKIMFLQPLHIHNHMYMLVLFFEGCSAASQGWGLTNEFPQKFFKTTEKHSLAVCGSLWGEKEFMLIFVPFYWFDQRVLFKQIQIFHRICTFSNL